MTNTTEDIPMATLKAQAEELGKDHGRSAASWLEFDEASAARCLQLDEEGDPRWDETWGAPAPLSGEFADSLTPQKLIRDELNLDPDSVLDTEEQELCDAYEGAFYSEHRFAALRAAQQHV